MVKLLLVAAVMSIIIEAHRCDGQQRHRDPGCVCPKIFSPVCGSDGRTYSNACEANCNGRSFRCQGRCPCSGGSSGGTPRPCDCCRGRVVNILGMYSVQGDQAGLRPRLR